MLNCLVTIYPAGKWGVQPTEMEVKKRQPWWGSNGVNMTNTMRDIPCITGYTILTSLELWTGVCMGMPQFVIIKSGKQAFVGLASVHTKPNSGYFKRDWLFECHLFGPGMLLAWEVEFRFWFFWEEESQCCCWFFPISLCGVLTVCWYIGFLKLGPPNWDHLTS